LPQKQIWPNPVLTDRCLQHSGSAVVAFERLVYFLSKATFYVRNYHFRFWYRDMAAFRRNGSFLFGIWRLENLQLVLILSCHGSWPYTCRCLFQVQVFASFSYGLDTTSAGTLEWDLRCAPVVVWTTALCCQYSEIIMWE